MSARFLPVWRVFSFFPDFLQISGFLALIVAFTLSFFASSIAFLRYTFALYLHLFALATLAGFVSCCQSFDFWLLRSSFTKRVVLATVTTVTGSAPPSRFSF